MNHDDSRTELSPAPPPPAPTTSLWARLCNILASPSEVFDEVRSSPPSTANWLVPALLNTVVACVATVLIVSQPAIQQQLQEVQAKAIRQQVEKGKLKAEQAEAALAATQKFATIGTLVAGTAGAAIASFASPFWGGLILWLLGTKALKGRFTYLKAVEAVGLSNVVSVLMGIVKTLLILITGSLFAGANALLLTKDPDPNSTLFAVLSALDVFTFWLLAVRAIGLSRLSGAGLGVSLAWTFGVWLGFTALMLGVGVAIRAVFMG